MLRGSIPRLKDPLDVSIPSHLGGFGRPEVGLKLNQFSIQLTSMRDWKDRDIATHVGLTSLLSAKNTVKIFGASMFGQMVEYQGIRGYDPDRIRQTVLLSCCPQDFNEPRSDIFKAHNMGEYGSGGLPIFLRPFLVRDPFNSARVIDSESRKYAHCCESLDALEEYQLLSARFTRFQDLALCRTSRAIQICWHVANSLDRPWGAWLLKVAVHAACTMERALTGDLKAFSATITLLQMSRELGYGLQIMLYVARASTMMATIASLLIEAGFDFISAGLCQIFMQQHDAGFTRLLFGLAEHCGCVLNSAARYNLQQTPWKKLVDVCVESSNFCVSRTNILLELQPTVMFHLIARWKQILTSRKLHGACGDSCRKAQREESRRDPGHITEGCGCPTRQFTPIESPRLVLFDTLEQELVVPKSETSYIAVSHVWFQGIFGQESRTCGKCSLEYLTMVCRNIGVRYAWIDTFCMPTSQNLREEVVQQLPDIYLSAAATLVVDAGLRSTAARTVLDLSLAILLSDWSSRIWTLEEGVLASRLLFCVGDQVLALPQVFGAVMLLNTRSRVPFLVLRSYGMRERAVGQALHSLLDVAAGRETSRSVDYLRGLSTMLPSRLTFRNKSLEMVVMEVAGMYKEVDLGILVAAIPRCQVKGYRWMPLRAKPTKSGLFYTGLRGFISPRGLQCNVAALIKLSSVADNHTRGMRSLGAQSQWMRAVDAEMLIKFWYSTETQGVFVGTNANALDLIFCLIGHADHDMSYGFVVSPTAHDGEFQYVGGARVVGKITERLESILVT